jgi:hypothetical protein
MFFYVSLNSLDFLFSSVVDEYRFFLLLFWDDLVHDGKELVEA